MNRRALAIIVGVVLVVALVAAGYGFRDQLRWWTAEQAPTTPRGETSPVADGGPAIVARGDVSVDPQRQQLIGVRLASVTRGPISGSVRTTGVVRADETRLADVNVKLDGWIRQLYVDYTGQSVQRGQPLFSLYSPELLTAQNEYLLALRTRDEMKGSPLADAREYADRIADAARQRLMLWDLPPEEIATLAQTGRVPDAVVFRSPVSGIVTEKQAVEGMHITPGQTLYKVADLSVVWIEADVYQQEIALARVGQRAVVTLDAYPGATFDGRAIYIDPFVDENTRTGKVRFQLANPRGRLKPGMYANVELQRSEGTALTVPADAVLDSGTQQVVFVAQGEGSFTPRTVRIGRRFSDRIEVTEGVKEGDQVAMGAAFFLDSESQLRAGLQNYESPPSTQPSASAGPTPSITFRSTTDPPRTGENMFEVTLTNASGQPVPDADVSVTLFMPAMPTMNMPAMRNETKLPHVGNGVYRGPGQVMMAGRWQVTVAVMKNGQRMGTRQFALAAR